MMNVINVIDSFNLSFFFSFFHFFHPFLYPFLLLRYQGLDPSEEEKMENKMWLSSYLEEVAKLAFTDVKEMKESGTKCFPPRYDIVEFFIKTHHSNLAQVVRTMCVCMSVRCALVQ